MFRASKTLTFTRQFLANSPPMDNSSLSNIEMASYLDT